MAKKLENNNCVSMKFKSSDHSYRKTIEKILKIVIDKKMK
jgi:hypothetical protein